MEVLRTFNALRPLNACVINPRFLEDPKHLKFAIVAGGQDAKDVTVTAAEAGGFELVFYNMMYNTEIGQVRGHFGPVHSMDINKDGNFVVTGAEDGTIRVHYLDEAYFKESD